MDWFHVAVSQDVSEHESDCKNNERRGNLMNPVYDERLGGIAEVCNYLHVAEQMIFDFDRNQINRGFPRGRPQSRSRDGQDVGALLQLPGNYVVLRMRHQGGTDELGIGAVD